MSTLMFEPITDEQEIQDTLNGRAAKGAHAIFLHKLTTAYDEFASDKDNAGKPFILPLNEKEGTAYFGKDTDSLYAALYAAMKKENLQTDWRLVRVTKNEEKYLRIVKL